MRTLYFTHCCHKKLDDLKNTGQRVPPMQLYIATPTQRFMKQCRKQRVEWAIFSDKYGFVFPDQRIEWYDKPPGFVTLDEKKALFQSAFNTLTRYDLAHFYYNPGRIHPLYLEMVDEMRRRGKNIEDITYLSQIVT